MPTSTVSRRLAVVYAACSIVAGPAAWVLGPALFTRGGGDWTDAVYRRPDGTWDPARDTEFARAHVFSVGVAAVLFMVGAVLLALLWRGRAERPVLTVLVAAAVAVMMAGYTLVALSSGIQGCGVAVCPRWA